MSAGERAVLTGAMLALVFLVGWNLSAVKTSRHALPSFVDGAAGGIEVVYGGNLVGTPGGTDSAWALWDPTTRTITIDSMTPPMFQWRLFYHELTHAALADAGLLPYVSAPLEEAIADAMATTLARTGFRPQ